MIIGGITAGGKTNSLRVGYSERFLPMTAFVIQPAVLNAMNQTPRQALNFIASARIRNVADDAWISLGTVSYFQVIRRMDGYDTASITVQKPETWSPFIAGGTYEDVLEPSTRILQVFSGVRIGSTSYSVPIFSGYIGDYRETQGPRGGAMNLECIDARKRMENIAVPSYADAQTAYRAVIRNTMQVSEAFNRGFVGMQMEKASVKFRDYDLAIPAYAGMGDVVSALLAVCPGVPVLNVKSAGPLVVGVQDEDEGNTGYGFAYTDSNIFMATRAASDARQFNAAKTMFASGSSWTTDEVYDTVDVAKRGKIYWDGGYIGGTTWTQAQAEDVANSAIARSLRGRFDVEVIFNPFLDPGSRIKISSTRFSLAASYATIGNFRHQYTAGRARTYLDDLTIVSA